MQADAPNVLAGGGTPPVESATVHGATLKIHFNSTLDTDSVPGKGTFSVSLAGTAQRPTGVSVSGRTLTLIPIPGERTGCYSSFPTTSSISGASSSTASTTTSAGTPA